MLVDCHLHTPLCGHATGEPREYVHAAARKGINLLTFTCHIPMSTDGFGGSSIRMKAEQLPEYFRMVEMARMEGSGLGIEVLCGIEAEIFPDGEIMTGMYHTLDAWPFDVVLGSLHHTQAAYQRWLRENKRTTDSQKIESYFAHLTLAAMSGRYHTLSHPDVIRIYGTVQHFDPLEHKAAIQLFLETAKTHEVCIEVNTSGRIKSCKTIHPDPIILDWAAAIGNRLTLGSDSHNPNSVGQFFPETIDLLKNKGFREVYFFRRGEPVAVEL
ncbi:MAG: histidinol-phosphatase [Verrucomicrobiota bacterium]|nr:histidinol-phosphatase [Verrucomicrobiota bacterium]